MIKSRKSKSYFGLGGPKFVVASVVIFDACDEQSVSECMMIWKVSDVENRFVDVWIRVTIKVLTS